MNDNGNTVRNLDGAGILVVEDEAIVADDIRSQLEDLGYCVVGTASSAEDAIGKADALAPDLVLMDIRLDGEKDGIYAAEQIRLQRNVPIVFLTANADKPTLQRAKITGPHGYLVKPFDERNLHTTVEVALYKGKLDQALAQSREDLLTILNAQRQGCIFVDEDGRITFINQAAKSMFEVTDDATLHQSWTEALPLNETCRTRLRDELQKPNSERNKFAITVHATDRRETTADVEVLDDPRAPDRKIVFFYDVTELHLLRRISDAEMPFERIVGASDAIEGVFQLIHDFASTESTVLIEGETGTGKELVAQAIHSRSRRNEGPFLALNCAGLSEELAASQLFGHRRGAFTGAVADQVGMFESAHGGTLFLDEIGELPVRIQTTLLRVLEERAVMRVGETRLRPCDVRIVAATNRDLNEEVAAGRFRSDLLFRIRVARILLPPLRDRREDIPILVAAFLSQCSQSADKSIERVTDEAMNRLVRYDWPGNVRELRHAVEFAFVRAKGDAIGHADLPPEIQTAGPQAISVDFPTDERGRILAALRHTGGKRNAAAKLLGMSRATFYRRLSQLGISLDS